MNTKKPKWQELVESIEIEEQKIEPSAYDMTDEEVANSVGLDVLDFDDVGDMIDELRDIMEGNV